MKMTVKVQNKPLSFGVEEPTKTQEEGRHHMSKEVQTFILKAVKMASYRDFVLDPGVVQKVVVTIEH